MKARKPAVRPVFTFYFVGMYHALDTLLQSLGVWAGGATEVDLAETYDRPVRYVWVGLGALNLERRLLGVRAGAHNTVVGNTTELTTREQQVLAARGFTIKHRPALPIRRPPPNADQVADVCKVRALQARRGAE